jgi:hypothetical protein
MLCFVGAQNVLGAVALFAFAWNMSQPDKAFRHQAALVGLVLFSNCKIHTVKYMTHKTYLLVCFMLD